MRALSLDYLHVSEKMKSQDIWFLLLISVIVAYLRLVGEITGFIIAKHTNYDGIAAFLLTLLSLALAFLLFLLTKCLTLVSG